MVCLGVMSPGMWRRYNQLKSSRKQANKTRASQTIEPKYMKGRWMKLQTTE